jgi:translation initiation factor IF-2
VQIKRPDPARPARGARDDRRRDGKLTVTRALGDDEGGARARSLAALKRAREKERRSHQSSGPAAKQVRDIVVPDTILLGELANRMAERAADLVKSLFKMGMVVTVNQAIDQDTAELLVTEFGHNIKRVSESDVDIQAETDVDAAQTLQPRPAVVTIMGHVDHGKTSLLDAIRGANVVSGEAGGITQHIGAYQVGLPDKSKITFLDTPGHEAFSEMRARGANVTDIVVLVVAADDGLKPQTVEAINHTKAAGVPMIVAINKIDKEGARAQRVREELLQHEIVVEDLGGDVQDVEVPRSRRPISKACSTRSISRPKSWSSRQSRPRAEGTVIEAKLDKGRGPLATVLVPARHAAGRRHLRGRRDLGQGARPDRRQGPPGEGSRPSVPVEVLGLSGVPSAGDTLTVVENEARAREVAEYRQGLLDRKRTTAGAGQPGEHVRLEGERHQGVPAGRQGDVQGSAEAIVNAVNRISTEDIKARILHSASARSPKRRRAGGRDRRADHRLQRPPQRQGA